MITDVKPTIKLDVGCGPNKKKGYVGVDMYPCDGVDHVVDLEKARLPFPDGSVDEIYTSHFLEHMQDPVNVLKDFTRVLKVGGKVKVIVPHYSNPYSYHFTHKSFWSSYSFEQHYIDYYLGGELKLLESKLRIVNIPILDRVFTLLANKHKAFYERFLSSFIRAWEIQFTLQKSTKKENDKNRQVILS